MTIGQAIADGLKGVYIVSTEESIAELERRYPNRAELLAREGRNVNRGTPKCRYCGKHHHKAPTCP